MIKDNGIGILENELNRVLIKDLREQRDELNKRVRELVYIYVKIMLSIKS